MIPETIKAKLTIEELRYIYDASMVFVGEELIKIANAEMVACSQAVADDAPDQRIARRAIVATELRDYGLYFGSELRLDDGWFAEWLNSEPEGTL